MSSRLRRYQAGQPSRRRRYGYRRIGQALRRRGMIVNHKRVSRIMREDNLLAIRYRKYILTTNSQPDCQAYLNLAARMTLTGVNQLWVADITYIRLRTEFVQMIPGMSRPGNPYLPHSRTRLRGPRVLR